MLRAGPATDIIITANGKNVYFDAADVLESTTGGELEGFKIVLDGKEVAMRERQLLAIAERPWVLDCDFELVQAGARYRGAGRCSYAGIDELVASVAVDHVTAVPS